MQLFGGVCGLIAVPPLEMIDLNRKDSNKGLMGNHRSSNHKDSNFINRAGQIFELGGPFRYRIVPQENNWREKRALEARKRSTEVQRC